MSYEDFVEGRQPMTGSDENEGTSSAGFRLETVPGILRRIAKRAETSRVGQPWPNAKGHTELAGGRGRGA
jgi:hypothetical protein